MEEAQGAHAGLTSDASLGGESSHVSPSESRRAFGGGAGSAEPSDSTGLGSDQLTQAGGVDGATGEGAARNQMTDFEKSRLAKFEKLLNTDVVDMNALKALSWNGVPHSLRPTCWRLMTGYAPAKAVRRDAALERKRQDYRDYVSELWQISDEDRTEEERKTFHQVLIDAPRTAPECPLFRDEETVQLALRRMLYIRAARNPASGYVQGLNDVATPFMLIFYGEQVAAAQEARGVPHQRDWYAGSLEQAQATLASLSEEALLTAEADAYWSLCALLDGVQDHYTAAQPGIQRLVYRVRELCFRVDAPCCHHIEDNGLEFLQFAFRWANCLLLREVPPICAFRLFDTFLAEGSHGLPSFLSYCCAALLLNFSKQVLEMEFQDMVMFLQNLPTQDWKENEMSMLLSQAYLFQAMFSGAS